jgi:hypothetical protein
MNFYAFDSFEGLPEIKGVDSKGFNHFKKSDYSCNLNDFIKNLRKRKVNLSKVEIIPGWFNQTLNQKTKERLKIKKVAIIWVDCDLYESTQSVLEFIKDYIQDGTIIIFDDWFCFRANPQRGEQRAFKEWLKKNKRLNAIEFHKFSWHGISFIINKQ